MLNGDAFLLEESQCNVPTCMSTIFRDLRKTVECYVDDIAMKSHDKSNHLDDLRMVSNIMRAHQLKMNPTKSFLGVSSGQVSWICRYIQRNSSRSRQNQSHPGNATSEKSYRTQRFARQTCLYPEIHRQSIESMSTFHRINKERYLLHLG